MPPSPSLEARITNARYFTETTTTRDQKTSESTPRTLSGVGARATVPGRRPPVKRASRDPDVSRPQRPEREREASPGSRAPDRRKRRRRQNVPTDPGARLGTWSEEHLSPRAVTPGGSAPSMLAPVSSARLAEEYADRGSASTPSAWPSVKRLTKARDPGSVQTFRAFATRCTLVPGGSRRDVCGSRPLAGAVTRSTGDRRRVLGVLRRGSASMQRPGASW